MTDKQTQTDFVEQISPDATAESASVQPEAEQQPQQIVSRAVAAKPMQAFADPVLERQFDLIERALLNPEITVEKLEAIQKMHYYAIDRRAKDEFDQAFVRMKYDLPSIKRLGDGANKKFARLEDIQRQIDPVLKEHGFFYRFTVEPIDGGSTRIGCKLTHIGGHSEESSDIYRPDTGGNKNEIQAKGSSVSYGKRQMLCAAIGIILIDEDDDGTGTRIPKQISPFQEQVLLNILMDCSDETQQWFAREIGDVKKVTTDNYAKVEYNLKAALKKYNESKGRSSVQ